MSNKNTNNPQKLRRYRTVQPKRASGKYGDTPQSKKNINKKNSNDEKNKNLFRFNKDEDEEKSYFITNEEENKKKKSFAGGLNFYKLFWVFFIGCFIGVVVEVLFCLAVEQKIECRQGVLYGPFNPVYGFGAVVITLVLYFMRNARDLWVFIGGSILGGAFEYLCSWYQETFLGTVSWNYEGQFGNIGGRTSIMYMLFWGILTVLWLKFIYPFMSKMIEKIPSKMGIALTWILVIFMALDMTVSSLAVYRMTQRHSGHEATTAYEMFMDEYYPDSFMFEIYPNMEVSNYK